MFSNTAYEAIYQYLGLELHSKFIEVITSQRVFLGVIAMTFGFMFFLTSVRFFSRYIPGTLIARKHVPLSQYVKIVAMLFLATSILRMGSMEGVKSFTGKSWHENPYVQMQAKAVNAEYRVSFVFDVLTRSSEEIAAFISRAVDGIFQTSHSQLEAPNFFFKAIMLGAVTTIEDPDLKKKVRLYTEECFDRLLPMIGERAKENKLDGFFADNSGFDERLSKLQIETTDQHPYNCLELKTDVRQHLQNYALSRPLFGENLKNYLRGRPNEINSTSWLNLQVSNSLVNEFESNRESWLGIQKGAQMPTTGGRIIQYLYRITGFDGILSFFSNGTLSGSWVAAARSQEFSENLARAPHLAGFIKMLLIAAFPWLLFVVVAGRWRVLFYWWLMYFSVLLWTPIWTLLYHIMVSIALSAETMEAFGKLNDGISLYSARLLTDRIYHLFAVYSWLQLLTATAFSGFLLYFLRPSFSPMDTETDSITSGASSAAGHAGSMASGAVKAAEGVML